MCNCGEPGCDGSLATDTYDGCEKLLYCVVTGPDFDSVVSTSGDGVPVDVDCIYSAGELSFSLT